MNLSQLFRRPFATVLLTALLPLVTASAAIAAGASSQREINSTGGTQANGSDGLRIWTGSNSQFQVNLGGSGQVYSQNGRPTGNALFNSVYLRVERNGLRVYGNDDNASFTHFQQVSQSAITGSGTNADPWQVTTVLRPPSPDNAITITIVDSYVRPEAWFTRRVSLSGMPTSGATIRFYQNIDTYLAGGDEGPGFIRTSSWNTTGTPDFVGVQKNQQIEALWHEPSSGTPLWNRYFSGHYNNVKGYAASASGNLPNTIDTNPSTDNGMAAQWNVPANAANHVVEYRVTFGASSADLGKAFSPATISAAGVSTLTFNITNRTTNSVSSINFTDTLPAGVVVAPTPNVRTSCPAGGSVGTTFPSGMAVTAAAGGGTIQVSGARINSAPANGQLACQVAVDVTAAIQGAYTNNAASISGLNNILNLVGNEVLTVVQPALAASKSVNGTLVAGQSGAAGDGHYLIQVQNTGTAPTSGAISLRDTLPSTVAAVAASSAAGTVDCGSLPASGQVNCTFTPAAPIGPGASATVRINVAVPGGIGNATLTNTVAVAGGGDPDPLPTCPAAGNPQCAQATSTIATSADVSITKTVSNLTPPVGGNVTFTLTASNAGPSWAPHVVVQDLLPSGYTFVSASPDQGTYVPATGAWTIAGLVPGATASMTIVATVRPTGSYANVATIQANAPDPVSGNNTATVTPTPTAQADVSVSKTLTTPGPFVPGQTVSFAIVVSNAGPSAATGIVVSDMPSNLTISGVSGACTALPCTIASLAPGVPASINVTGTVQAAGAFTNTAAVTTATFDPDLANNSDTAAGTAVAGPSWTLDKTTSSAPTQAGQAATYTFTATNTGGVAITGIVVTDARLPGLACTIATLAPGESRSCAASGNSYTLTQGDVDAGQVVNSATATGTPAAGTLPPATDTHILEIAAAPDLAVTKVVSQAPSPVVIDSVIEYTVTATNTGNVSLDNVIVSDPLITPGSRTCATLAPNATCTLVGTYTVTQADVDAGTVRNTATANSDQADPRTTPEVTTPVDQSTELAVSKVLSDAPTPVVLGSVLEYTITATNTGTVTLTNVVVTDNLITPDTRTCATLAPGAECILVGTYTVTQADVDAGVVRNTATADSNQTDPETTPEVTTPVDQTAELALSKVLSQAPTPIVLDSILEYTITATNTGTVTMTNVVVTDNLITPNSRTCATLAPNADCTLVGTYTVTQADVDVGVVRNTATADSNQTDPETTPEVMTPVDQTAELALAKVLSQAPTPVVLDSILEYTITATNTGTVTLTNVVVTDSLITPNSRTCATLAPGAECILVGTYTVTQADVDAGVVRNTATADSSQTDLETTPEVTTPVEQTAELALNKVLSQAPTPVVLDSVLEYTVTATNTGTVTLTNVVVTDSLITPSSRTCATLAPNATCTLVGTYTVTQADVDAGVVRNTATADSNQTDPETTPEVTTPVDQTAELALAKVLSQAPTPVVLDSVLEYTITATNTGTVTLTNVVVTDNLITPSSRTCATLAPNAECTLVGTYTVTQADVNAGVVRNTATADSNQTDPETTPEVTTPVDQSAELALNKVLSQAPTPVVLDSVLEYTITATNTGTVTLTNVVVTDNLITPDTRTCATLAPNATCTLIGTYTVTQADVDAGVVRNTATADSNQTDPETTPEVTTPVDQSAELALNKVLSQAPTPVVLDSVLEYTITAANTGTVTLTNVVVTDNLIRPSSRTCATLAPGAECTLVGTYTVTQADVDAGIVRNTATGDSDQTDPETTPEVTTPVEQTAELALNKVLSEAPTPVVLDSVLEYTITATNTGTVTLTNVVVTDSLITPSSRTCATLAPNAACTLVGTYTVTQADVDAGVVRNTATADSTQTDPYTTPEVTTPVAQTTELALNKVLSEAPTPIVLDSVLEYTITATNTGTVTLTNVVVTDNLITPSSRTCETLAPNAECTLVGTYAVTQADVDAGTVRNTATADSDQTDAETTPEVTTPVEQSTELALNKVLSDAPTPIVLDSILEYTITATNTGTVTLNNVIVDDPLITPDTRTCATLAPGAECILVGTYTVTQDDINAGEVRNTAVADADGIEPESSPEVVTPVDQTPQLSISKALTGESLGNDGMAAPGEQLTYTITVRNTQGASAQGVVVNEVVPQHTTFASGTPAWSCAAGAAAGTACDTIVDVPAPGASGEPGVTTLSFVVTVDDPLPSGTLSIANAVALEDATPPDCGSMPGDPACVVTPTIGDVTMTKAISIEGGAVPGIAEPGESLTYAITLSNGGGSQVTGFGVTDALDANTSFVAADHGGVHADGVVRWSDLVIPANGQRVLTVTVAVVDAIPPGVTLIANVAYETGSTPPACPGPGAQCATIPTQAAVSVSKALSGESFEGNGLAEPGEQLTYTITLRNEGGTSAQDVLVNETVPAHTSFVSGQGWSCAPGAAAGTACDALVTVPAATGPNAPGIATLTFTVMVDDPLPAGVVAIANAVALDDGTPPDCAATPGHPGCAVTPTVNVALAKSVVGLVPTGPATYVVTYLIEVDNIGGADAGYTLTDTLGFPTSGVVFTGMAQATTVGGTLSPTLPGGQFTPSPSGSVQLSDVLVNLPPGASHDYLVSIPIGLQSGALERGLCTGNPGDGLFNHAAVSGSFDLEASACTDVSGNVPVIRLVKTVALGVDHDGDRYGDVGDVLHYRFAISNPGTLPLSAVQLVDPRVTDLRCDAFTAGGIPFYVFRGDELFDDAFEGRVRGGVLVPGDSIDCTATYVLTQQDVDRRRVVNAATASGAGPGGQVVTSTSTAIFSAFQ
jgi:uncharacterized repeat protein (TIGR01451 family)